jgi:hypothetical protein
LTELTSPSILHRQTHDAAFPEHHFGQIQF